MERIPLVNGRGFALVDDADVPLVSGRRWYLLDAGHTKYAFTVVYRPKQQQRNIYMQCLIMGQIGIDHIDHNGLNNQRSNLRVATSRQNHANQRKTHGASQFKGVYWHRERGLWMARVGMPGRRQRFLGRFASEEDAARAYDAAALEEYGEFAWLNFPVN
jgi:hypothetical protein